MYRSTQNYENQQKMLFDGVGISFFVNCCDEKKSFHF